jgi:hypothetical protein
MNKKLITYFIIGIIVFCGLVGYNYLVAQKKIKETRPSPLGIYLESFPEKVTSGQTGTFIWNIDSSPDLFTPKTTIYWDYNSTPSALTQSDSPEAVGYEFHQDDYFTGIFKLPDTFELAIKFVKPGKVYLRAYAKVGDNHLWTDEKTIEIISQKTNVLK